MSDLLQALADVAGQSRRGKLWYCHRDECDGNPHEGAYWCEHPLESDQHDTTCRHARTDQRPPEGDWMTWLYMAGRGTGKTRSAAEWVTHQVLTGKAKRIALVGRTPADVRDVMIEGESGLIQVGTVRGIRPEWQPTKRRLVWPNGAQAFSYSAEVGAQLRGPQHDLGWCVAKGTLVSTLRGDIPIELVRLSDRVATRQGWFPVTRKTLTKRNAQTLIISTEDSELQCTPDHRVWVEEKGFIRADQVACCDKILAWKTPKQDRLHTMNGVAFDGIETPKTVTTENAVASFYTTLSTLLTMVRLGKGCISTTLTTTAVTTFLKTSLRWIQLSMFRCTRLKGVLTLVGLTNIEAKGHPQTQVSCGKRSFQPNGYAWDVAQPSLAVRHSSSTVPEIVPHGHTVLGVRPGSDCDVYDLTVEGSHEFFANGVLVHNCDESAAWSDAPKGDSVDTSWNNLVLGLRLGKKPRIMVTTTPKPVLLMRQVKQRASTAITTGSTYSNLGNLSDSFKDEVLAAYEGTRLGRQEIYGELLEDIEGALWSLAQIDALRVKESPELSQLVVSIDPAGGSSANNDETGILVVGKSSDGHGYVLEDLSGRYSPSAWARVAIGAYEKWDADRIVGEINFGGDMVENTLRAERYTGRFEKVRASRGKTARAEPISALYGDPSAPDTWLGRGRIHHVGSYPKLEDQMTTWVQGTTNESPDRMDSLVWGLTALGIKVGVGEGFKDFMSRSAENRSKVINIADRKQRHCKHFFGRDGVCIHCDLPADQRQAN